MRKVLGFVFSVGLIFLAHELFQTGTPAAPVRSLSEINSKEAQNEGSAVPPAPDRAPNSQLTAKPTFTPPEVAPKAIDHHMKALKKLNRCLDNDDCDFPQEDPRSYEFAVSQRLAWEIESLAYTCQQTPALCDAQFLEATAEEFFIDQSGIVQHATLKLFAQMEPTEKTFEILEKGIEGSYEPLMFEFATPELKRHMHTDWQPKVDQFLIRTLAQGALTMRESLIKNLLDFLNDDNFEEFVDFNATLPDPKSLVSRHLEKALREFDAIKTGG